MGAKQMLYISMYVKGVILLLALSVITAHRIFSQKWFSQIATPAQIQEEINQRKYDINGYNMEGLTPLMYAITLSDIDRVKMLIAAGADVNLKDRGALNNTALHMVGLKGNLKNAVPIMELLLNAGADPKIRNRQGGTPVHYLWYSNFLDGRNAMLKMLLEHGVDINAQDDKGKTFIHQMVDRNDSLWYDQVLLAYGGIINLAIKDNNGRNAYEYADFIGKYGMKNRILATMEIMKEKQLPLMQGQLQP